MKVVRADAVARIIGKLIDVLVFLFLTQIFQPFGAMAGFLYLAVADGFAGGRSIGKYLTGLRVVDANTGSGCSFRASVLRNLPVVVVFFFYVMPFLGWVLFITAGLLIIVLETYFIFKDEKGQRIGDTLANTVVISEKYS